MTDRSRSPRIESPASIGSVFDLIRRGTARTRREISRQTALAPSTVSLRVDSLIAAGLVEEAASGQATGGRQPRFLRVRGDAGAVVSVALGTHHFRLAVADLVGRVLHVTECPIDVALGPAAAMREIWERTLIALGDARVDAGAVRGMALGVPAPIDSRLGTVTSSAQLPGWGQQNLYDLIKRHTELPVSIQNDANLLALAEFRAAGPDVGHMLAVKVGSRIGSGVVVGGRLYSGSSGAAGEISHSRSSGRSAIHCWCGTPDCLESVAGGAALVARLRQEGYDIGGTADLVALAGAGDARAVELLREAGGLVGEVLSYVVNFLNPDLVTFGGQLSGVPPFVAAIRAAVFQQCLPVVTDALEVRVGTVGTDAEILGGIQLILDRTLDVNRVDKLVANGWTG
ncbi:ROK family transcriptional regulator [Amycolatopsis suaedae]|uniref:ROK family protein n=1 Tax=Amycolatopsis suaedae TaxID=2510978 RepID=A0A4Q7J3A5_9PSEU|nr:ROK family protein [Amycolatopsis suaedae]RZQ61449.1 ROK family protein [Amycolatopsis suaedae]